MRAMLFAAGLGTRLRPLTNDRPKALVEVGGRTLLEWALLKLKASGVEKVVINVHHFAGMVREFLRSRENFGLDIAISDESALLLDTGGGLKKAQPFLEGEHPFLVMNVDVLSTIDLNELYDFHLSSGAVATLAVRDRPTSRYLLFDNAMSLRGWQNVKTGEVKYCGSEVELSSKLTPLAFSGIHVISPAFFSFMPSAQRPYSIITAYLEAGSAQLIKGFRHDADFWLDVGKPYAIEEAHQRSAEWAGGIR